MHLKLISAVIPSIFLSVVPVFGQDQAARPTYRGAVFGESERIRADFEAYRALEATAGGSGLEVENFQNIRLLVADLPTSGPRLTDCTLFGSFPEPDRHPAASAKPFEFLPHRDFRSNGHYFPHI